MPVKSLRFRVQGEDLTNLFRNLYWQDRTPLQEVLSMMKDSIDFQESSEVLDKVCISLLEGQLS